MTDRNWDAELAKIDKQLSSISDDQLVAEQRKGAVVLPNAPAGAGSGSRAAANAPTVARGSATAASSTASTSAHHAPAGAWASWLKVSIAVAAAVGLMFWPWPARCGIPLLGFTAAAGAVALLGLWSAFGTWKHRLGLAHAASLLVVVWGLLLSAREVLPRVGYAVPTVERSAGWSCDAVPLAPVPGGELNPGQPAPQPSTQRSPFGA